MNLTKADRGKWLMAAAIFIFAIQATASFALRRPPFLPSPPPLSQIPIQLGGWSESVEQTIAPDALTMLAPDDFVVRLYSNRSGDQAELFVAYYKTQLRAKNAHDPKVCLPGAGWNPTASRVTSVSPSPAFSFPVNYYRIKKGDTEQVVLYWFQTFDAVYAFEQQLVAHRVWSSIFKNRTDMALVRIIVPVSASGIQAADDSANRLAEVVYGKMLSYFPGPAGSHSAT